MTAFPGEQLVIESRIAQQRTTIASLKRDDHETADAEPYLRQIEEELGRARTMHIDRANDGLEASRSNVQVTSSDQTAATFGYNAH